MEPHLIEIHRLNSVNQQMFISSSTEIEWNQYYDILLQMFVLEKNVFNGYDPRAWIALLCKFTQKLCSQHNEGRKSLLLRTQKAYGVNQ